MCVSSIVCSCLLVNSVLAPTAALKVTQILMATSYIPGKNVKHFHLCAEKKKCVMLYLLLLDALYTYLDTCHGSLTFSKVTLNYVIASGKIFKMQKEIPQVDRKRQPATNSLSQLPVLRVQVYVVCAIMS